MIEHIIFEAIRDLFVAGVIILAWKTAHDNTMVSNLKSILWKGFLWCAGISFFASIMMGNPTCIDSDQDIRGITCYEYANNEYEPTSKERIINFIYFMIILYTPVLIGAFDSKREWQEKQKFFKKPEMQELLKRLDDQQNNKS